MKVYYLVFPPSDILYGAPAEFEGYQIDDIRKTGADVVFYWYNKGAYDGCGQVLFRAHGKWFVHDAGHCSCYGPTDALHAEPETGFESLDAVLHRCSDEYGNYLAPLIALARKKGYK